MKRTLWAALALGIGAGIALISSGVWTSQEPVVQGADEDRLWQLRNLGKAFYENPTTQAEAVEQFRQALALSPKGVRERLNYGLALLRAAKTKEGVAELLQVQQQDAKLPHTWFNLGITYKKEGETDKAIAQFAQMAKLVPDEPITHYNLGVLLKLKGDAARAIQEFETASKLSPLLAAPHFQLYNAYRTAARREDAMRELQTFQQLKKSQEGAAIPEDMEWSDYAEIYDPINPELEKDAPARSEVKFTDRTLPGTVDTITAGLLTVDLDGDGNPDLLAWSKSGLRAYRNGAELMADPGWGALKEVYEVAAADVDNDGLIDLAVLTKTEARLFKNSKGKFTAGPVLSKGQFRKAVWIDYDHDYDMDLILLGDAPKLLRNQGEAGFADRTSDFPFAKGEATDGVAFRVIADSKAFDLAVSYQDHAGVLYRDRLAGKYEAVPLPGLPAAADQLVAVDWNNDSFIDLSYLGADNKVGLLANRRGQWSAAASKAEGRFVWADLENLAVQDLVGATQVLAHTTPGQFAEGRKPAGFGGGQAWARADFNGDGRMDLATVAENGSVHVLQNATATKNTWLRVGLVGVKNLKLAPYAEVEIKAGTRYQKQVYQGLPLTFGLRTLAQVETVRITWPNGLIQNEVRQPTNKAVQFKEAQRLSGSCPMIFTWDGERFQFITDVLGVAPLGATSGDGQYFPTDHDEYVQIAGSALKAVDGKYRIRMTEELGEVSYLDQLQLMAVDHPADVEMYQNDKWKSPPYPEFRLFGVKKRVYPVKARTGTGENQLPALLKRDQVYADGFRRDFTNVAETHALELDFGNAAPGNRAVLVLNGWVDWADGSTFLKTAQEGKGGLMPPSLQVRNARGEWQTVMDDMGMPSGKTKTIAVDLSGKFLTASREVRIVTNMCVFWDEAFLGEDPSAPSVRLTKMAAVSAEVRFHGFSRNTVHPQRKKPEHFDYAPNAPTSLWNPTPGNYTRYGDVRPLVLEPDDRFVVMGSGDEVRLEYNAASLPPLLAGWTRDFLLLVDGWAKDADANTAYSQSVEPLPFHRMTQYPYGAREQYPTDQLHADYRREYLTRPALRLLRPLP